LTTYVVSMTTIAVNASGFFSTQVNGIGEDPWPRFAIEGEPGFEAIDAGFRHRKLDLPAACGPRHLVTIAEQSRLAGDGKVRGELQAFGKLQPAVLASASISGSVPPV
jgi:hypothetical protein